MSSDLLPAGRKPIAKTAWYAFTEDDFVSGNYSLGVIRCPKDDRAEYDRLVAEMLSALCLVDGSDVDLLEPEWRWYRMNPDPTGEFSWILGRADGPGPGNWMGAQVISRA